MSDQSQELALFYVRAHGEEHDGRRYDIGEDGLLVGRADICDVIFESRDVSRRHAYFYRDGDRCFIEDLGSQNGTLVNGHRVDKQRLADGNRVTIGPCRFVVTIAGPDGACPDRRSRRRRSRRDRPADYSTDRYPLLRHPLAVGGVVFGLLAYLHWGFGLGALVLAGVAWLEMRGNPDRLGRALVLAAVVLGLVGGGLNAWFGEVMPRRAEGEHARLREACRQNLEQVAAALEAYAEENGDPPRQLHELTREGLASREALACPAAGTPRRYLYAPGGTPVDGVEGAVVLLDPAPDGHGGRGGWVRTADGRLHWLADDDYRRVHAAMSGRADPGPQSPVPPGEGPP